MTTKLVEPLKREIEVNGVPYTLTITPRGLMLVVKGRRKGYELEWSALVSGDAALAAALNASLALKLPPRSFARGRAGEISKAVNASAVTLSGRMALVSALCARAIPSKSVFAPDQVTDSNIERDEDG
jgi:hypothetical protein